MYTARKTVLVAATLATALSACSTRPRNFAAEVSTPVADRLAFEQDYRTCQQLVASGHSNNFKSVALQSVATGAGAFGTGVGLVSTGAVGITSSSGAAAAATAAMPVVGVLLGFGVSRAIRGGRERKFKRNMSACLTEYGYEVADWEKLEKRDDSATFAARYVTVSGPSPAEQMANTELTEDPVEPPVAEATEQVAIVDSAAL